MKTYNEKTGELIENPDMESGYTYTGQRYIGTERMVLGGTVDLYPPDGLYYDKPVYEDCLWYHEYTDDEKPGTDPALPGDVVTWDELVAAYNEGVGTE